MGEAAVAGVGRHEQAALTLLVMKRVIEARDHSSGIPEGGVGRDVLDALAVDIDFAAVSELFEVFGPRHGPRSPALSCAGRPVHFHPQALVRSIIEH